MTTSSGETPIAEAFQAKVIEDSVSPYGIRLTTLQLRYPRFIHSEFMTHRQFSRNARSSRAVPVKRLRAEEPYIPHFMKNQAGMQSFEELTPGRHTDAEAIWLACAEFCKGSSGFLEDHEVHKQWANRMLEWFGYIDVVVSSTYWKNFYNLRDHPMAMPEIQHLAIAMRNAMDASIPKELNFHQWHLPYVTEEERSNFGLPTQQMLSTARCARVSYKPFDAAKVDPKKDVELAEKLIVADPLHASPAEHQATPDELIFSECIPIIGEHQHEWGNFFGWRQHRKMLPGEAYNEDFSPETLLAHYERNMNGQVQGEDTEFNGANQ